MVSGTDMTPWTPDAPARAVGRLEEWAREADAAWSLAQRLADTSFCPEQFRRRPAEAAAAMLAGGELGLSPLTALNAFDVIGGRPAARAITLRALAQARGHEIVLAESTATRCRVRGRRAGSTEWQAVTWTIDRAQALGLTTRPQWRQQPQAMLVARATAEMARLIAADALLGIGGGISAEEVADGGAADVPVAEVEAPPTRRVTRRTPPPDPDAPTPQDDTPPPEETPPPSWDDEPVTTPQLRALHATLRDAGVTDRDTGLLLISQIIDRDITSSKGLTRGEASRVIDHLKNPTPTPDDPAPDDDAPEETQ